MDDHPVDYVTGITNAFVCLCLRLLSWLLAEGPARQTPAVARVLSVLLQLRVSTIVGFYVTFFDSFLVVVAHSAPPGEANFRKQKKYI
jgi:hypothetical protein